MLANSVISSESDMVTDDDDDDDATAAAADGGLSRNVRRGMFEAGLGSLFFIFFLAMPLVPRHQMASWLHVDVFHPIEHVEAGGDALAD
ncbi:unnamed protein product [Pleuronectes platessa]|uniref:Uncharacterized protein n=1 Tax=Pleuronectes platessa TaxID=8262 RepID=A0A9N7Z903_PLEPL|nr:unnamed protein product [Pleuronectes platessa]